MNDLRPVALTSVAMKVLERFILDFLKSLINNWIVCNSPTLKPEVLKMPYYFVQMNYIVTVGARPSVTSPYCPVSGFSQ